MIKISTKDLMGKFINNGTQFVSEKPCIIDFNADWCQPCKAIEKTLTNLELEHEDLDFYTINVEDEYELAEIFSIRNLPTVLYCTKDEIKRMSGNVNKNKIEEEITKMKVIA